MIQQDEITALRLCWLFALLVTGCGHSSELPVESQRNEQQPKWLDPQQDRVGDTTRLTDHGRQVARPEDWFVDVTVESGLQHVFHSGRDGGRFTILETVGGGVCLFDTDGDGDLDVYCAGGGTVDAASGAITGIPGKLFRNEGQCRFTEITQAAGLATKMDYSHGAVAADYDRDGDQDLFVFCFGRSRLFRNDAGRFEDVTQTAGLSFESWDTGAVFVDLTNDGWPDLYVATYVAFDPLKSQPCGRDRSRPDVCPPQDFAALPDRLYVNQRDGTFADRSEAAGLTNKTRGLGVLAADFNDDGWLDLYVANDGDPNSLFWGSADFPWNDGGLAAGVAVSDKGLAEGSMGLDTADIDGDGRTDLIVTNFELEDNSLYRNLGGGQFEPATARFGLAGASRAYVGFGTGLQDFDGDNWPDLYVLNGHVLYHDGQSPFRQPSFVFRNDAGQRFVDVSSNAASYFRERHAARGSAATDLDGDGGLDLVISGLDEPICVLRNHRPPGNWVTVQLESSAADTSGVGASVSLTAFDRLVTVPIRAGTSFASHVDPRATLALEKGRPSVDVSIRWLSGRREIFRGLTTCQQHRLREGTGDESP